MAGAPPTRVPSARQAGCGSTRRGVRALMMSGGCPDRRCCSCVRGDHTMPKRHQSTSAPQRTATPHGMTPTILGRQDTVAVLIQAPFDAWYDQWMLQIDDTDDAVDPAGVDFFDDAVRMLESAAIGMAVAA